MNRKRLKYFFMTACHVFLCILFQIGYTGADEALLETITEDLKPIDGFIIKKTEGLFLLDLDRTHGIAIGDIFSVTRPGEPVIHPVTGKQVGETVEIKAVLKVTHISDGFSYARALAGEEEIKIKDPVSRYNHLSVAFRDYSGRGLDIYNRLARILPELRFGDYKEISGKKNLKEDGMNDLPPDALLFTLENGSIEIRDHRHYLIHRYQVDPTPRVASKQPEMSPIQKPVSTAAISASAVSASGGVSRMKTLQPLPEVSVMADFLRLNNSLRMVSTDSMDIHIFDTQNEAKKITTVKPPGFAQVLAVKWWVPKSDSPPYIAASLWSDDNLAGAIYLFDQNRLIPVVEGVKRILGTFDLDGDTIPETLLAQTFEEENFYGSGIRELELVNGKIREKPPGVVLPKRFTVLGSTIADLNADGALESVFIRNGMLYIYSGKKRMYKSKQTMGGSISFLSYDVDPSSKDSKPASVRLEMPPVALDIDRDGILEILAPSSKQTTLGRIGVIPDVEKSYISIIRFDTGRYASRVFSDEAELSLQGMVPDGNRMLLIGTTSGGLDLRKGNSFILSLPI